MMQQTFLNPLKALVEAVLHGHRNVDKPAAGAADTDMPTKLNAVAHFSIPATPEPAPGYVFVEDGQMKLETKLSDYERRREALLQPLAHEWIEKWLSIADLAARFNDAFDELEELNAPKQTKRVTAGKKPSLSVFLLDRSVRLSRARNDTVRYEEDKLLAAKALVDECVTRWSEGGRDEIRQLAEMSFTKNAKGEYSRSGMVRLRRMNSTDPLWEEAMNQIRKAEIVDGVTSYLLVSVRDKDGKYHPLPMDIASIKPFRQLMDQGAV